MSSSAGAVRVRHPYGTSEWDSSCTTTEMEEGCAMLNDESFSFEKYVSQGDHEGNLEAADEDGFESDEEFVAVLPKQCFGESC